MAGCRQDPFYSDLVAAIEASEYEFAYEAQLREVLCLSDSELAFTLQLQEAIDNSTSTNHKRPFLAIIPPSLDEKKFKDFPSASSSSKNDSLGFEEDLPILRRDNRTVMTSNGTLITANARQAQPSTSRVMFVPKEKRSLIVRRDGKEPAMEDDVVVPECVLPTISEVSNVRLPCMICLEMKFEENLFPGLDCSHSLCIPCLVRYVQFTVFEGKLTVLHCPDPKCGETAYVETCEKFLPSAMAEQWKNLAIEKELAPESCRVYCPFKECQAILIKDIEYDDGQEQGRKSVECPMCNRLFCMDCLVPWHADLSCKEYKNLPSDERTYEDSLLRRLAKDKKWQQCSKCKHLIELKEGCNHITCRCGYQFCYICGGVWTSSQHLCNAPVTTTH